MLLKGFAQQLANELSVDVMAPTEALHIGVDGDLFISDNDELAYLYFEGENVIETGKWITFKPEERK